MVRGRKEGIYENNKNKFLYTKCGGGGFLSGCGRCQQGTWSYVVGKVNLINK